jgi:hypothetical protein
MSGVAFREPRKTRRTPSDYRKAAVVSCERQIGSRVVRLCYPQAASLPHEFNVRHLLTRYECCARQATEFGPLFAV